VRTAPRPFRQPRTIPRPVGGRFRSNRGTVVPFPVIIGGNAMQGSNGRRVRVEGSPWQPIDDACESIKKMIADPVAMEAMNAATTAWMAVRALGMAMNAIGKNNVETVAIDPKVAAFMEALGQYILKAEGPTRDAGDSIRKAHQPKIDRIEEGSPKEKKWDLTVHEGRGFSGQRRFGRRAG
jgi:DNA-binding protein YbaB